MNFEQETRALLNQIGPGKMKNTAYDTAWIARLGEIGSPLGRDGLAWLRENQLPDGSWGEPQLFYHHDRLISTLSAMIALARNGDQKDRNRIRRARMAVDVASKGLTADFVGETIGFEMIVPTLFREAQDKRALQRTFTGEILLDGLTRKNQYQLFGNEDTQLRRRTDHYIQRLKLYREKKLAALPEGRVNRFVTVAFSAEMAGTDGRHMFDTDQLLQSNGSVAYSPSATAYYALYIRQADPRALAYLEEVTRINRGGAPNVAPFDIFEPAWVLWNLGLLSDLPPEIEKFGQPHLDFLQNAWLPGKGVGFAAEYPPKDGDETALTYEVLSKFGRKVDFEAVLHYEEDRYFRCFQLESNPSVSANIHILGALRAAGYPAHATPVTKVVDFLWSTQLVEMVWFDKWHVSPYYPTTHAVIAAAGFVDELIESALTWMIQTQRADGSWGYYCQTAEETAYCLQALLFARRFGHQIPSETLKRGLNWLAENQSARYPALWIGKCLYCPELVVKSAIISALWLGHQEGLI